MDFGEEKGDGRKERGQKRMLKKESGGKEIEIVADEESLSDQHRRLHCEICEIIDDEINGKVTKVSANSLSANCGECLHCLSQFDC